LLCASEAKIAGVIRLYVSAFVAAPKGLKRISTVSRARRVMLQGYGDSSDPATRLALSEGRLCRKRRGYCLNHHRRTSLTFAIRPGRST
jgi:hypothetical protein